MKEKTEIRLNHFNQQAALTVLGVFATYHLVLEIGVYNE